MAYVVDEGQTVVGVAARCKPKYQVRNNCDRLLFCHIAIITTSIMTM